MPLLRSQPHELDAPKRSRIPRRLLSLALAAVIGAALVYAVPRLLATTRTIVVNSAAGITNAKPIPDTTWQGLNQQLSNLINAHPELEISVSVIDITNHAQKNFGIQAGYEAASTTKVLSAVTFLHQVEQGNESLTESLADQTAQSQLQQMINQSNNDAWAAINSELTHAELAAYAQSIGLTSYDPDQNIITAADYASLLSQLYQGKLLNQSHTNLLLGYMQNTNNEQMIPAVAPAGAQLYHKYGQLDDRLHDGAIVTYHNRPIVLVIYTKSYSGADTDYTSRTTLVKQLAQTVFSAVY